MNYEKLKEVLESGKCKKELMLYGIYQNGTKKQTQQIPAKNIVQESMKINQKIIKGSEFKIGGCISSQFSIKLIGDVGIELKDLEIQVDFIVSAGGDEKTIHLFHGKITESEKDRDAGTVTITAYDAFGVAGDRNWGGIIGLYTIREIRSNMFAMLRSVSGVTVYESKLPEDETVLDGSYVDYSWQLAVLEGREKHPSSIEFLAQMCELNCTIGFIDGEGVFRELELYSFSGEFANVVADDGRRHLYADSYKNKRLKVKPAKTYIIKSDISDKYLSGVNGFVEISFQDDAGNEVDSMSGYTPVTFETPEGATRVALTLYDNQTNADAKWEWEEKSTDIIPMQNTKYEDCVTQKITGITYFVGDYQNTIGTKENTYAINDTFTIKVADKDGKVLEDLYKKIIRIPQFTPVKNMPSIGYPGVVNVGDMVSNGDIETIVLERTLTGIQGLKDVYVADVEETLPALETNSAGSSSGSGSSGGSSGSGSSGLSEGEWVTLELNDGVTAVAESCAAPRYRLVGNHVFIEGGVAISNLPASGIAIATLPEAYRPAAARHYVNAATGVRVARLCAGSSGIISLEWIYDVSTMTRVTGAVAWVSLNTDYFID